MCTYSMIADHWRDKWQPQPQQPVPYAPQVVPIFPSPQPTPQEVEDFRKDAAELKRLLERAKKYDEEHGELHCELDEKKQVLQKIADRFGVQIEFP